MSRAKHLLCILVLFAVLAVPAQAQEIVFASIDEARRILSTSDDYSKSMSAFDRAARMKTERETTESDFLAFAANAALDWAREERDVVEAAFGQIRPTITGLGLPLPARIAMITTSGAEDAEAAYTRQNAIILPMRMLAMRGEPLRRLLAHELFHVSTRAHPRLADRLYEVIGFHRCGAVELPAVLESRRITNPDAPRDEHCIEVNVGAEKVWALPVLQSGAAKADFARGAVFLQDVTVMLLLVERPAKGGTARPLYAAGAPRVVPIDAVSGFFETTGRNTGYIIHPEEIVADNFALLALGRSDVPSPEILERIRKVIAEYATPPK